MVCKTVEDQLLVQSIAANAVLLQGMMGILKEALVFALASVHGVLSVLGEHPYWASISSEWEPVPGCSCYRMLNQILKGILMVLFSWGKLKGRWSMLLV